MTRPIEIGDRVKRTFELNGQTVTEVGIVVHIWRDPETDLDDAYISFFGGEFPNGKPETKPVILRYFLSGLQHFDP